MHYLILGALAIGLSLGLLGSGGSILTVPVLVYLLGHQDKVAIAESLGIVGSIALLTAIPYARARLIDWRSVIFFGVPGMAGTYAGAWLAQFVSGTVQLALFGCVMLLAAVIMFRRSRTGVDGNRREQVESHTAQHALWKIAGEGILVGVLTGLVGVGGGFLIVPALVILGRLPMRLAVGTSLAIIALNSFSGFFKHLSVLSSLEMSVDWRTMAAFILIGMVGGVLGHLVSSHLNQQTLKRGFAVFLIIMGFIIIGKESRTLVSHWHTLSSTASSAHASATFEER